MLSRFSLFPPLSLAYVAAVTPESWEVKIVDENFGPSTLEDADLVGITAFTSNIGRAYQLAASYREKGIPVVLGGIHASMLPEEALQHADAVVKGEVEGVWGNILEDFEKKQLRGIYQGPILDLSRYDILPRRDLLHPDYLWNSIQTSRGCPSIAASALYPDTWEKHTGNVLPLPCYKNWLPYPDPTCSFWTTT